MLTHQCAGLENFLKFNFPMSVHRGLLHYLSAEHPDDDLGNFPEEFGVLKNSET